MQIKKLAGHCSIPLVLLLLFFSLHQSCLAPAVQEILTCVHLVHPPFSLCLHVLETERELKGRVCVRERKSEGGRCCATERGRSSRKKGRDEGIRENIKREEKDRQCVFVCVCMRETESSGYTAERRREQRDAHCSSAH